MYGTVSVTAVWLGQSAKHPMMVIGAGANRKMTCNMLRQFVTRHRMPFCDTQMGKGVIDSSKPWHHCPVHCYFCLLEYKVLPVVQMALPVVMVLLTEI